MSEQVVVNTERDRAEWLRARRIQAATKMVDGLVYAIGRTPECERGAVTRAVEGLVDLIESIESEVKL